MESSDLLAVYLFIYFSSLIFQLIGMMREEMKKFVISQ